RVDPNPLVAGIRHVNAALRVDRDITRPPQAIDWVLLRIHTDFTRFTPLRDESSIRLYRLYAGLPDISDVKITIPPKCDTIRAREGQAVCVAILTQNRVK